MTPLLFGYVSARRTALEMALEDRQRRLPAKLRDLPLKERLGRALIHLGEHLAPVQPSPTTRRAA